jgi:hypothetical protein
MHSTQNAVANHEYRSIPITALAESATNPRKRFDAKSLEELAAYVPRYISGLLCRWSFCGGERPVAREKGSFRFRRAHNVRWHRLALRTLLRDPIEAVRRG